MRQAAFSRQCSSRHETACSVTVMQPTHPSLMLTVAQGQPSLLNDTWQGLVACHASHMLYVLAREVSCRAVTLSTWHLGSKGHTTVGSVQDPPPPHHPMHVQLQ